MATTRPTAPLEALEPGNDVGVNDLLDDRQLLIASEMKPENGSTVVIVCLLPV